ETYFEAVAEGRSREELVALREKLRLDKTVRNLREATEGAKDGAERVRDIVADLRRLSADGGGEAGPFDLVTTARIAADWVKRGTKTPVEFAFEGSDTLLAVGAAGPIQQIVMNLIQNALDALAETQSPCITLCVFPEGGRAVLQVKDNGPGIDPADASSIFDPFFTTKEVGKGTGLGLSISHKIAEDQDGSLNLVQTSQKGSVFELALPLNADGGGA
ncbi:MAG: ATP-binding protein, partial [Pseudomonadota bacterium]